MQLPVYVGQLGTSNGVGKTLLLPEGVIDIATTLNTLAVTVNTVVVVVFGVIHFVRKGE